MGAVMETSYASPIRRLAALVIDLILIFGVLNLLILQPNMFPGILDLRVLISVIVFMAYEGLMCYFLGATVGKLALGLTVVDDATLEKLTPVQCATRPFAKAFFALPAISYTIISILALIYYGISVYNMATDGRLRTLHDLIAKTVVIKTGR